MGHHTKQHGVQHVIFELIILLEPLIFLNSCMFIPILLNYFLKRILKTTEFSFLLKTGKYQPSIVILLKKTDIES